MTTEFEKDIAEAIHDALTWEEFKNHLFDFNTANNGCHKVLRVSHTTTVDGEAQFTVVMKVDEDKREGFIRDAMEDETDEEPLHDSKGPEVSWEDVQGKGYGGKAYGIEVDGVWRGQWVLDGDIDSVRWVFKRPLNDDRLVVTDTEEGPTVNAPGAPGDVTFFEWVPFYIK